MSAQADHRITEALSSVRRLQGILKEMTNDQLVKAIALEEAGLRRESVLTMLYRQSRVLARKLSDEKVKQAVSQTF